VAARSATARSARPGPADVAILLAYAQRVIIVPGYGLAVAQAQHTLRELVDLLGSKGIVVDYAIHPVPGRMPGHMNVLLAEAQVPYEQLKEMDEINGEFKQADVVLVVGANDVVNPRRRPHPARPSMACRSSTSRRPAGRVHEALDATGVRRHRERAVVRAGTTLLFGDARTPWPSCSRP
jgi:NAD(P) transhydrogenase subunit beta